MVDTSVTPTETHSFTYDGSYRVSSNTQGPRGTLSYTYTPEDRVQTMAVQSGPTQTFSYYPDGSLDTITRSVVSGNFKYTYTPTGQYQEVTFPNGQHRDYSYDDQGRLTQLSNTLGATTLASSSYGYDHDWTSGSDTMLGQRTSMTATVQAQGLTNAESRYFYDPLYQLVKAQYPAGTVFNGETHEWTYDALGNRISSKVNGTGPSYTYLKNGANPLNGQRLNSDGVNNYSYDANGSQTARTGGTNYAFGYDVDNRLTGITGADTATYTYDYQGRRTSKTEAGVTTTYLYDGLNPIAAIISASPTYFLNGPSIDEPLAISASGTISYLNADGLGSVVATNNAAGTVSHSLSFDAWGAPRNETGTRAHGFTYTGREVGIAGMHFYRARFMQAGVGRFSQEDPFTSDLSVDLYGYANLRPAERVDPFGLIDAPGPWESLIPVWGSGRSAINDFQCGRWGWGAFNTALAASDIFLVKSLITGAGKGLFKVAGSHSWGATRQFMQKRGWYEVAENPEGHHWLMERNQGWAQDLPEWLKNQPPNINVLERDVHQAIPEMGRLERLSTEVPEWAKALFLSTAGHGIDAARTDNQKCGCK